MDARTRERIKRRRGQTGLTQQDLARYARVSSGTIANLERGSGEPEQATWERVLATLGWVWAEGDDPVELLPAPAVQRMVSLIDDTDDRREARRAADFYIKLLSFVGNKTTGLPVIAEMGNHYATCLAEYIWPKIKIDDPIDTKIVELLQDQGWSPEDLQPGGIGFGVEKTRHSGGGAKQTNEKLDVLTAKVEELTKSVDSRLVEDAKRYAALPLRLRIALMKSEVADLEVSLVPDAPGMEILHLVLVDRELPPGPFTIDATLNRWTISLAVMDRVLRARRPSNLPWQAFIESVDEAIRKLEKEEDHGDREGGED